MIYSVIVMSNEDETSRMVEFNSPSTDMSTVVFDYLCDAFSSYHDELTSKELFVELASLKSRVKNKLKVHGKVGVMADEDDLGWYTITPQS